MDWIKNARYHQFLGKRLISVDYGTKVVGLSFFVPGELPFPTLFGRIIVKNTEQTISELVSLSEDECLDAMVIGVPYLTDGKATDATQKVKEFIEKLKAALTIPLYEQDETLSTYEAEQRMLEDPRFNFQVDPKRIDEVSATIIMEDFLNSET